MLKSFGSLEIALLLLQMFLLCMTIYEAIRATKFLKVAKNVKRRGALIYGYILALFSLALWAVLLVAEPKEGEYMLILLAYVLFYNITREVKERAIE